MPKSSESSQAVTIDLELPELTPDLYINRELSWLDFNQRVLEEMEEQGTPLLERVKFAAIFSSNLDEFYMIRVAGVKRKVVNHLTDPGLDGRTPIQVYRAIHERSQQLLARQARGVRKELFPALAKAGIEIVHHADLSGTEKEALQRVFEREVFPVLTPQAIDRGRRFPHVSNDSLNLIVVLKSKGESRFARVKVPALLPRFVPVPATTPEGESGTVLALRHQQRATWRFTPLEELIAAHMDRLFPGSRVVASYPFHLLRDSDVEPDEDDDDSANLLEVMKETISQRPFGSTVRIDVDETMPKAVRSWLVDQVHALPQDVYVIDGLLGMEDLFQIGSLNRPDLNDVPAEPSTSFPWRDDEWVESGKGIFEFIRDHDVLLHTPYQSFGGVVDFVAQASRDADVVAIKQTLYRLGKNSPLIPALIQARDDDTQVAVLVELKARFDEENNIEWAQTLENRGVHVAYGLAGLKTHSKLTMVVRREDDGLRRYCHIGTGNYNAGTARTYEDIGLFTCSDTIADDVTDVFNVLTGYAEQQQYNSLWVAPHSMRSNLLAAIAHEVSSHRKHGNGHIILKMNSLVDKETIRALYAASQAGVRVDLIVRGVCCLRPGVKGVSDTIRVRSLVGRYLEHSRIFYFWNNGKARVYIGSADAMERNFDRRVEVVTQIQNEALVQHMRENVLDKYLHDTVNAREMEPSGAWIPVEAPKGAGGFDVQAWFTRYYRKHIAVGTN
jgi:polyphosphate kinase